MENLDQPIPRATLHCALKMYGVWVTAIAREWEPGDAERCQFCPKDICEVTENGTCLVLTDAPVNPNEAYRYSMPPSARR